MGSIKSILSFTAAIIAVVALVLFMTADPAQTAEDDPYPVLLVHGLASGPDSWDQLPDMLHNRGFDDVYVLDFSDWEYVGFNSDNNDASPLHKAAAVIAREVHVIGLETKREKVNIIAHSIGGLAVRAYLAGWGEAAEKRGKYSDNVSKVVYINTPFFGFNPDAIDEDDLKTLLEDTNWGDFMKHAYFLDKLYGLDKTLIRLHEDVVEAGVDQEVEEVTIMTGGDNLLKPMSANLSGIRHNPFTDTVDKNAGQNHVTWLNYQHAHHELIGSNNKDAITVNDPDHPILQIAPPFFNGSYGWRSKSQGISGDDDSTIIMALAKNSAIDTSKFSSDDIRVWKNRPNTDYRLKDVIWHADDELLEFDAINSGDYYLFLADDPDTKISFSLNVILGATHPVYLDPNNLPSFDNMPKQVNNLPTVREAALAIIGRDRLFKVSTTDELQAICREIRDGIVAYYPQDWMLNLPDSPSMRLDILRDVDNNELWDFYIDWNKGSRKAWDHLNWLSHGVHYDDGDYSAGGEWPKVLSPGNLQQLKDASVAAVGYTAMTKSQSSAGLEATAKALVERISDHYSYFRPDYPYFPGFRKDILIYKQSDGRLVRWDFYIGWDKPPSNAMGHLTWIKHHYQGGIQKW